MQKSPFLRYALTTLSAITLIPLSYTLITEPKVKVVAADDHLSSTIHRHGTPHHNCSHCTEPSMSAARKAAQASKVAGAGQLWEKSSPDPTRAVVSMQITSGTPEAENYSIGSQQRITLEDGTEVTFEVKSNDVHADGTIAVDAIVPGNPKGKLHIQWNDHDNFFLGQIEYPNLPVAYEIKKDEKGIPTITRHSIDELLCSNVDAVSQEVTYGLPSVDKALASEADPVDGETFSTSEESASLVPALNSYPSASAVLYLDFDGEVVLNTSWGSRIDAAATGYSVDKITDIWKRVATDMKAFNLNVTTEESVYLNADATRRIRCIITPSNEWYGSNSAGGVAYVGSFTWSGDTPCWIFSDNLYNGTKYIAEACAHETGHTFGLQHDGKLGVSSYYAGHGSGAVGWAPIMGNGYYKELTQWSKGEYTGATNTQDDLAIITSTSNGFGYRQDDSSDQVFTATAMISDTSDQVFQSGVIEKRGDVDVFSMVTGDGSITLDITPAGAVSNLDIEAELYDADGNLLATANPATLLNASISRNVSAGTYYLYIRASGYGSVDTGSSDYASLGAYTISGQMAPEAEPSPYELTVASLATEEQSLNSDPDHDGLSNLAEHVFGTDPAVANVTQSFTSIESAGAMGINFILDLPSDIPSDALYTIEATCSLSSNDWSSIASRTSDGEWTLSASATITEEEGPNGKRRFRIVEATGEALTCRFMRVRFELSSNS